VGVAVLGLPQDCNCGQLLFWVASVFCACFDVGAAFFSTTQHSTMLKPSSCVCESMQQQPLSPRKPQKTGHNQTKQEQPKQNPKNF
jgi:hypothetical protein